MICKRNLQKDCDGCMECQNKLPRCYLCEEKIKKGASYYLIFGRALCEKCIEEAREYFEDD